ncbi:MAG: hypothetical protein WC043_04075 [Pseudobdellovibrionaceae bacterium]
MVKKVVLTAEATKLLSMAAAQIGAAPDAQSPFSVATATAPTQDVAPGLNRS